MQQMIIIQQKIAYIKNTASAAYLFLCSVILIPNIRSCSVICRYSDFASSSETPSQRSSALRLQIAFCQWPVVSSSTLQKRWLYRICTGFPALIPIDYTHSFCFCQSFWLSTMDARIAIEVSSYGYSWALLTIETIAFPQVLYITFSTEYHNQSAHFHL